MCLYGINFLITINSLTRYFDSNSRLFSAQATQTGLASYYDFTKVMTHEVWKISSKILFVVQQTRWSLCHPTNKMKALKETNNNIN